MVLRLESIQKRLQELDRVLNELVKYQNVPLQQFQADLSLQWTIERGLIAATSLMFDMADHILAGEFGLYRETYEGSLEALHTVNAISENLYMEVRGLGGFRNVLVHRYLEIDLTEVYVNYHKALEVLPRFAQELIDWLERQSEPRDSSSPE